MTHMNGKRDAAESFAARYDRVMVPVIFRPWAQELLRRCPAQTGTDILDLACGTGAVTREIIASGAEPASLTGADMSEDMLAVARTRAEENGITAAWTEAVAEALPFDDQSFDLAYCQQALQFFPDRVAALRELNRVLRNDARVAFCVSRSLTENPLLAAQASALEIHVGPAPAAAVRAICSLSDPEVIRHDFEAAGFQEIEITRVSLTLSHPDGRAYAEGAMAGMHTGDKISQLSATERQACIDEFLLGLGSCFDGQAIEFPHVSNVITARR